MMTKNNATPRLELVALGLCPECRARPAVPGMMRCAECNEKTRRNRVTIWAEREALGLCIYCMTPALPERKMCAKHGAKNRAGAARIRAEKPEAARQRHRVWEAKRRAAGLCVRCGKPAYGYLCTDCADRIYAQAKARRDNRATNSGLPETDLQPEPAADSAGIQRREAAFYRPL